MMMVMLCGWEVGKQNNDAWNIIFWIYGRFAAIGGEVKVFRELEYRLCEICKYSQPAIKNYIGPLMTPLGI